MRKGEKMSDELKKKMSESRKGDKNQFWGKHHSEKTKKLLSKIFTGRKVSKETRKKMSISALKRIIKYPNTNPIKLKPFKKGHRLYKKYWFKKGCKNPKGENHWNWKGDNAGKSAKHYWIENHFGKPNYCENPNCSYPRKNKRNFILLKPKKYHWASANGHHYTKNRKDYMRLCVSCHKRYDLGLIKLKINYGK